MAIYSELDVWLLMSADLAAVTNFVTVMTGDRDHNPWACTRPRQFYIIARHLLFLNWDNMTVYPDFLPPTKLSLHMVWWPERGPGVFERFSKFLSYLR